MGAQGVWMGSLWLAVKEADAPPAQLDCYMEATSKDTVRSRSWTGKPCRMLKNEWTDAWEKPESPGYLPMPLQGMVTMDMITRTHRYADKAQKVAFNPVGQVVGQFTKVEKTSAVIQRWVQEYLEATSTLEQLNEAASV